MDVRTALLHAGLSEGEVTVYLTLLQTGQQTAQGVAKHAQMHRTGIYDFLEKLQDKGLVTHTTTEGTKSFQANNPQRFMDLLEEKQDQLRSVMPELQRLTNSQTQDLSVEVLKGKAGFIAMWNEILRTKEDYLVLGSADAKYADMLGSVIDRYFRKELKLGIKQRVIIHRGTSKLFNYSHITYRFLPEQYPITTSALIFGNKVATHIWNPISTVLIENKDLADGYRTTFEMLWDIAKK